MVAMNLRGCTSSLVEAGVRVHVPRTVEAGRNRDAEVQLHVRGDVFQAYTVTYAAHPKDMAIDKASVRADIACLEALDKLPDVVRGILRRTVQVEGEVVPCDHLVDNAIASLVNGSVVFRT